MDSNQVTVETPVSAAPEATVVAVTPEATVVAVTPEATAEATQPVVVEPVSKPKRTRKAKTEAKPKAKAKKVEAKRGRGRPVVFKGNEKKHIVSVIRKHGLTVSRAKLAEEKISISLPTLGKLAKEAGIKLHRGRPAKAA